MPVDGRPAAVLWDMDGTLVDTEPYWIQAEFELIEGLGGTWTREHALELVGNDLIESGRYIARVTGIDLTPEQIVEELLDRVVRHMEEKVPWRPGARELLADLRAQDIPCALVTMSYQRFVEPALEALPAGTFDAVVTGDAVSQGKPHPEPYLEAARRLGVSTRECVAIEDSNTGTQSAEAAGCLVLVVLNHVEVDAGERRVFRDSLTGLDAASLGGLLLDS